MSQSTDQQKRHILVVEDERIVALHTRMVLQDAGYRVSTVGDGKSACEIASADHSISLILMDIDLGPDQIDGTDAAACILSGRDLPIVFHTSHDGQEMVARVKSITRYGYVLKLSGPFVLLEAVTTAYELFAANQRLRERERELDAVATAVPGVLYQLWMDPDGNVTYPFFGAGIRELAGYSAEEITADPGILMGSIPEEDLGAVRDAMAESYRDLCLYDITHRFTRRDGSVRWFHFRAMPRKVGESVAWTGIAFDVTSQRELQQEARRNDEAFHRIFMQADLGLAETDLQGTILRANPTFHRMLGYPTGALRGLSIGEITWPDDWEVEVRLIRDVFKSHQSHFTFRFPKRYLHREGHPVEAELRGFVMRDPEGRPTSVVGMVMDLSERVRLSEAAAESQALFEGAFQASPLLAAVATAGDWKFLVVNDSLVSATGWSREELAGTKPTELGLVTPTEQERLFSLRDQGHFIRGERSVLRRKDGSSFPVRLFVRIVPLQDKPRLVAFAQDITAEEDRTAALESALEGRTQLMDELVHRVRNNLQIMASLVDLKDRALGPSVDLSDLQAQIQAIQAVHEALSLTEKGQPVNMADWLRSLVPAVFEAANMQNVSSRIDAAECRLPARDALAIGLIVNELATNAAKHAFAKPNPGKYPEADHHEFQVTLRSDSEYLVLVVENSGTPITRMPEPGSGHLGLGLVASLATQLVGTLSLETEPRTRFTVRFPRPAVT